MQQVAKLLRAQAITVALENGNYLPAGSVVAVIVQNSSGIYDQFSHVIFLLLKLRDVAFLIVYTILSVLSNKGSL